MIPIFAPHQRDAAFLDSSSDWIQWMADHISSATDDTQRGFLKGPRASRGDVLYGWTVVSWRFSARRISAISAGLLLVILIFFSVAGNVLVCVAIYTDRGLRRIGNLFLASLAVADLFVGGLVMTFAGVNDLLGYWIFGMWFCDIWIAFDVMCSTASILNLCAISLDRYIHIKDPLRWDWSRSIASKKNQEQRAKPFYTIYLWNRGEFKIVKQKLLENNCVGKLIEF